jgi:4-amino-4-deoxy-L-arabinose transferase-like glycosyltransferase
MAKRLHFGWFLTALLAGALVLRLGAGVWWQQRLPVGTKFAFGDSESYWELGRAIAHGEPFAYGPDRLRIFRTPGYPAVLAPLFWLRDEPPVLWARALGAILGTIAVATVAGLAWLLFDQRVALIAAAIAAVYPEAIASSVFVLSEAPFIPLMMGQLICLTMAWRAGCQRGVVGWAIVSGFAAGVATLMRPSWLLFLPFVGVVGFVFISAARNATEGVPYSTLKRHVWVSFVSLLALCLTMAPWWVRNYRVAGRFVPTSLQVGASLYDGISPTATGASDMRFVTQFVAEQRAADALPDADLHGLFEDRLDRRMQHAAVDWAKSNPQKVAALMLVKLKRMWSLVPNAGEFQSTTLRLVLAATYTPIIVLALIGAWRFCRRDWPRFLCLLPAVYFTLLHIVFVSSIRYRQPAMLPLIVLAAAVVASRVGPTRGANAGPPPNNKS